MKEYRIKATIIGAATLLVKAETKTEAVNLIYQSNRSLIEIDDFDWNYGEVLNIDEVDTPQ